MILKKEERYEWKVHHYRQCNIYFMSIFLLFNIVDRMKFICIFSVKLCSFCNFESIFNTVLTISIYCMKPPAKFSVIPLAKGRSVVSRLRYSKSSTRIFKFTYAIFYLRSFTFTIFFSRSHMIFFGKEKLFVGFWRMASSYDSKLTFV